MKVVYFGKSGIKITWQILKRKEK